MLENIKELAFGIKTCHEDIRFYLAEFLENKYDHLRWGYWPVITNLKDFRLAQVNLFEEVKSYFPNGLQSIIDVGGGIGGTTDLLLKAGYKALCVVPDKELIKFGKIRFPGVDFLRGTAECFKLKVKFDAALLIESYQYFTDHRRAISNITRNLASQSFMVFAEEFYVYSNNKLREGLLKDYLAQENYYPIARTDISEKVLPTCDFLVNYFKGKNHKMTEFWMEKKKKLLSGDIRYLILVFQREKH